MTDNLLKIFFEKERWELALQKGLEKDMDKSLLRYLTSPEARIEIYRQMRDGEYTVHPPHEARIPKDDGTYRTVYANDGTDRIVLSIINDMLFELCPEFIHPNCKSYQKGIGCGKIVQQASKVINTITTDEIGVKIDLSKYFDSVPIEYIDSIFDSVEHKLGKSKLIDIVRNYYHDDTVLDINKQPIQKYSSLRQGCAVAAFLADAVLYDIDAAISSTYDVYYVRYSDDILLIGKDWRAAFEELSEKLNQKNLSLNPRKIEILSKNKWFKFLGFSIKNDMISLSNSRIKSFQHEIDKRTILSGETDMPTLINTVNRYLYVGTGEFSWATSVLPIINVPEDINLLNSYVMDAIRASVTGHRKIGGLGQDSKNANHAIVRGAGKNVTANKQKIPHLKNYNTIKCMQTALLTSKPVYNTLIANM